MQPDRRIEIVVPHHVKDRGEGFLTNRSHLSGHFDKRGPHIIACALADTVAAMDDPAFSARGRKRPGHRLIGRAVDQRPDEHVALERIANSDAIIGSLQPRDEALINAIVDKKAPRRRAALSCCPHRSERDAPQRKIEIGRWSDDHAIIAAEFEDRARETLGKPRCDRAAHARRSRRRHERDARIADERLTRLAPTHQEAAQTRGRFAEARGRAREYGLHRERGQRRLFRRLPHDAVAANERERRIPGPDRNGKVERRDDPDDAERMPDLHHPVSRPLGCDGEAVKLA